MGFVDFGITSYLQRWESVIPSLCFSFLFCVGGWGSAEHMTRAVCTLMASASLNYNSIFLPIFSHVYKTWGQLNSLFHQSASFKITFFWKPSLLCFFLILWHLTIITHSPESLLYTYIHFQTLFSQGLFSWDLWELPFPWLQKSGINCRLQISLFFKATLFIFYVLSKGIYSFGYIQTMNALYRLLKLPYWACPLFECVGLFWRVPGCVLPICTIF